MIQLVLKRSATVIEVIGVDRTLLFAMTLLGPARGTVVPLRGRPAADLLPSGHYAVAAWTRGDDALPAHLELVDLELRTEARLIDAGSARRGLGERLLDIGGIGAPTGGLGGRRAVAIYAGSPGQAPAGGGLRVERSGLLRLIDLLDDDPSHGTVVLTVAGEPYPII